MSLSDVAAPPPTVDERWLRRARDRHAESFVTAARVPHEITGRLLEHLAPIRCAPRRVLDLGAGDGHLTRALEQRYSGASVFSLDPSVGMLRSHRRRLHQRLLGSERRAAASPGALPLASTSVDLVCSNLALSSAADLMTSLRECRRVLRADGVVLMSLLGPDSFKELRAAWAAVDGHRHVHAFLDMHDVGDAMVRAGFSDVVVDVDRLTVEFGDFAQLLREMRAASGGNAATDRSRGLVTRRRLERVRARLRAETGHEDRLSLEVVYAHAWAAGPSPTEVALPRRVLPGGGTTR